MTVTVRFLLRHRLSQAIEERDAEPRWRLTFFLLPLSASLIRSASMGEILPARRAGRRQEISTVAQANRAEPIKIMGLAETTAVPSMLPISTGTRTVPNSQPRMSPTGMPTMHRRLA